MDGRLDPAKAFGVGNRDDRFYRYTKSGWKLSTLDACADMDYSRFAIDTCWGTNLDGQMPESDRAAGARAYSQ